MPRDRDFIELLTALSYDPVFVVDQDRRITHFNEPFAMMLGLRAAQRRRIEGTVFSDLIEFGDPGQACIADCLSLDRNVRVQSVTARVPDGRELVLEMSALPLRGDDDRITGVVVLHRDVTDEHRLKVRYHEEKEAHLNERESLLRIIKDRDIDIERLKKRLR